MTRLAWRLGAACVLLAAALLALDRAFPPDVSRAAAVSTRVLDRHGALLRGYLSSDGMWRLPAGAVDPAYVRRLVDYEDRRFWWHPGIDPLALGRAVLQAAWHGRIVSGGSTLTMQTARLLEPHPHTVLGKLRDLARALQLEERYGKREILALYLALAPMGGNLEGVRAASLAWFGHPPDALSPVEQALLVAVPQRPVQRRPDRHPAAALAAARAVLARTGPAPVPDAVPLHAAREALRGTLARHFADQARRGGGTLVATTLDAGLQRALDQLGRREAAWLEERAAIAAVVVENRGRAVRAVLENAGHGPAGAEIDMTRAPRSPGSALKPFIYALALDDRAILPDTVIEDAPQRIAGYAPADFDRSFRGGLTARVALQQSANLPAVALLARIGPRRFAASLALAGAHLSFPGHVWAPSLPMALGGVGIPLADLAALYAGLADDGWMAPLAERTDAPGPAPTAFVGADAARSVLQILRGAPLPDGASPVRSRAIAIKTGTSYGYRDAVAVGVSADWTVAVWVGRPDGTPRPDAIGRATAAPLVLRIFDLLPRDTRDPPLPRPGPGGARAPELVHWRLDRRAALPGDAAPPRIVYPPDGARLATGPDGIGLDAAGGRPPYVWVVNGQAVPAPPTDGRAAWQPDGPGFDRITVIDSGGRESSVTVRLE